MTLKVFPRDCFACGKAMVKLRGKMTMICRDCEVTEDAAVTGRFSYPLPDEVEWCHYSVIVIDHGKEYVPSPG